MVPTATKQLHHHENTESEADVVTHFVSDFKISLACKLVMGGLHKAHNTLAVLVGETMVVEHASDVTFVPVTERTTCRVVAT